MCEAGVKCSATDGLIVGRFSFLFDFTFAVHHSSSHVDSDDGDDEDEQNDAENNWNLDADEVLGTLNH